MEKSLPMKPISTFFTFVLFTLFSVAGLAQSQDRYMKELKADGQNIRYELKDAGFYQATNNYTDAQLNSRYAVRPGFVSIERDVQKQVFYIVLQKGLAQDFIKTNITQIKESEIIRLNPQPTNSN